MRLSPLLAGTSAVTLAVLLSGRALLSQLPRPTPTTAPTWLALQQRWALNPERRREAALLRASGRDTAPAQRRRLLAGQGWGRTALAAVVLKQQALDAQALGAQTRATALWQRLLRRLGDEPASADALYALGQQQPALHGQLLQRWPAHPAALAAASEEPGLRGAVHLARWGSRWPGARERMRSACSSQAPSPAQRQQLAQGLAELGDGAAALDCLGSATPGPATTLLLATAELAGDARTQATAISRLQTLMQAAPNSSEAPQALLLLSQQDNPAAEAALQSLRGHWRNTAAAQSLQARRSHSSRAALAVVQRWPTDPASWDLQWDMARTAALAGRWAEARTLLSAGGTRLEAAMPVALQARRSFWLALSDWQLGRGNAARQRWQQLLVRHPGGYYGWRAASRLGLKSAEVQSSPTTNLVHRPASAWSPLASGDARVDLLWRLGQPLEAWEAWRSASRGRRPRSSRALQAEGRLRESIGDGWAGLGMLELAALRLPPSQCPLQRLIETERYRRRQDAVLSTAAQREGVPLHLLLGVAKQESRFQSTAQSVVGAAGLLQLMPDTAADLAGRRLSTAELHEPQRNARLGSRYLRQLLDRWNGDPALATASYNAGPNAVAGWLTPMQQAIPELWVEAIPYPETRHYVKTVLGNAWSFQADRLPRCS